MARSLFLLIMASIIGVICNPIILAATDDFALSGIDNTGVVETVPLPEPEPEIEPEPTKASVAPAKAPSAGVAAAGAPVATVAVAPVNNIQVAGRTIQIVDVADTVVDSGNHVNKYGSRFLYGHNSAGVFGGLAGVGVGGGFSVTYGGVTTNYQVANVVIFEKNAESGLLQLNGFGDYMYAVSSAVFDGVQYDMALMTCYGTSYGNGDASHRLVIFANMI